MKEIWRFREDEELPKVVEAAMTSKTDMLAALMDRSKQSYILRILSRYGKPLRGSPKQLKDLVANYGLPPYPVNRDGQEEEWEI